MYSGGIEKRQSESFEMEQVQEEKETDENVYTFIHTLVYRYYVRAVLEMEYPTLCFMR